MKNVTQASKFLSLILRHKPEVIGITLDEHGWADVNALLEGMSKTHEISLEDLNYIVNTDSKQRYSFNKDYTKIRANQGHSIDVDVELKEQIPPDILYHGSGHKYSESIRQQGLISKSRLYVHLSTDLATAENVGARHGSPDIYRIDAKRMYIDGYKFYLSKNGVWLTKFVPVEYLYLI